MIQSRLAYGTFDISGAPARVDYCGRRYYPADSAQVQTLEQVDASLAENGLRGLRRVDTAPSGMPIVTNVLPRAVRAQYHTDVCTIVLWVQSGLDAYVAHSLSGGP